MAVTIMTKNTFVEIEEKKQVVARRSASMPPCMKLAEYAERPQHPAQVLKDECDSSSTVGGSISSQGSTQGFRSWDTDVCSVCTQSTETSACSNPDSDLVSSDATPSLQAMASAPLCMLAPARIIHMRQTPGAWEAMQAVALCALTALAATGGASMNKSRFGWQIVVKLAMHEMHMKCRLLSLAKAAILSASERSSGTYVVGYRASPFMDSPLGFSALLAHMIRPAEACWDLLQHGFCYFEGSCRWQHPQYQATVNVMVVQAHEQGEA
eukprot:TRINITY_DN17099_c0_g1_i1.p1 TRINITY_DN17099_c0_g1~~TRINITY_DN17099_c0_g1_i1.p1  ORF type:complete len:306 (+),score=38.56 TRINITY_DN17099_c0_g1_i1:117-920(+)